MEKLELENKIAKKHILEIHEEHPHYSDEAVSIFLHETSWGKEVNAVVEEAHEYLERIEALLDDARENGNKADTDMYEYLDEVVHADFCKKQTEMNKAFCTWAHNILGWSCVEWYGLENPFSEVEE